MTKQTSGLTKVFKLEHSIYFNETNAVGGVAYFSNYVKWQGMAREEWFVKVVPNWKEIFHKTLSGELNMITVEEHSHFIQHAFFSDKILIELRMANIKKFSFDMIFFMKNLESSQLVYEGMQRLAFDDFKGRFLPIPPTIYSALKEYEVDTSTLETVKLKRYFT